MRRTGTAVEPSVLWMFEALWENSSPLTECRCESIDFLTTHRFRRRGHERFRAVSN